MSIKLKALGLGPLAVMAMGAIAAMNASATVSGHFTSSVNTTTVTGTESLTHKVEFAMPALSKDKIHCNKASYHGHITGTTVQSVTLTPNLSECTTTEGGGAAVHIKMNGCAYVFFSRTPVAGKDATFKIECPAGKKIDILDTGTGCTLQFGEQTVEGAIYGTDLSPNGKHSLTITLTAKGLKFTAHSGICVFVGTNQAGGEITGSLTLFGDDTLGNQVDITAT